MGAAGSRRAGDLHDDLDGGVGDHRHAVIGEAGSGDEAVTPPDGAAGSAGAFYIEVGDGDDRNMG